MHKCSHVDSDISANIQKLVVSCTVMRLVQYHSSSHPRACTVHMRPEAGKLTKAG